MIQGNISFGNGPEGNKGFKGFAYAKGGTVYVGNLALNNLSTGMELRFTGEGFAVNNLSYQNDLHGIWMAIRDENSPSSGPARMANNISYNNDGSLDFSSFQRSAANVKEPKDDDLYFVSDVSNFSPNTNFPANSTIEERHQFLYSQFVSTFLPNPEGPLIDAGVVVAGVHCATADDSTNPPPSNATCRRWTGAAPDIGPFESNVIFQRSLPVPPVLNIK